MNSNSQPVTPERGTPERTAAFDRSFLEDLRYWVEKDRRTALRLLDLVEAVRRDPFSGTGQPERLKHFDENTWSRRLTQEHRVVYLVLRDRVIFLQARYHY